MEGAGGGSVKEHSAGKMSTTVNHERVSDTIDRRALAGALEVVKHTTEIVILVLL